MVVFPNAKINIGLNVIRRRNDGYHDIETLMAPVDWCDVLEIVPSTSGKDTLTVSGIKIDCPPEKNLVMKAIGRLRLVERLMIPAVDVYLNKNIPDGAGLGGGSADAAFAIMAVDRLFSLNLTESEMSRLASEVGSDCPFFISNTPKLATGRGDILSTVDAISDLLNQLDVVIIKPDTVSVSTGQAYAALTPSLPEIPLKELVSVDVSTWKERICNDFEKAIFPHNKNIGLIKQRLYDYGAVYASMTGSGSAVYGLFERRYTTLPSKEELEKMFPDCYIHEGKFLLSPFAL